MKNGDLISLTNGQLQNYLIFNNPASFIFGILHSGTFLIGGQKLIIDYKIY